MKWKIFYTGILCVLISTIPFRSFAGTESDKKKHHKHKNDQEQTAESGSEAGIRLSYHEYVTPEMIIIFKDNSPEAFNDPDLPRFAIMGKNKKAYLGVGGFVKGTASFDFNGVVDNATLFMPSMIPLDPEPGNGGKLQYGISTSNIFFNFVALPESDNRFDAYINADFGGPNYTFRLRHAYIDYRNFRVGYTASLFTDLGSAPTTIDNEGPNGWTFMRHLIISYTNQLNSHWKVGISAEVPAVSATVANSLNTIPYQRYPDIPAYVQYSWHDGKGRLRLSGLLRNMVYRDLIRNKNIDKVGWGVQLSGSSDIGRRLTAFYQLTYGTGIGNYFQDVTGFGVDMVPDVNNPGKMKAVSGLGGFAGIQFNFTKRCFLTCSYSQLRLYKAGDYNWPDGYKRGQYVSASMFYNIMPNLQIGSEYLWGKRQNMDNDANHANRLQIMTKFNF